MIASIQSFRACNTLIVFEKSRSFSLNSLIEFNISLMSWTSFFWFCCTVFSSWLILSVISLFSSINFETCASIMLFDILWIIVYKIASFLYRSYGSRMFLDVSVSSNRSRTSSRNAFSDNQTVVISCSAIIWFWNSVWIARCVVFLNSSRLIDSLLPCWLFGSMWWIE